MKLASITSIALLATIFSACGGAIEPAQDTDPPVGTASQCIINGDVVTEDTIGTPLLYGPGWGCSSTFINDTWLITAHHCLTYENVETGGTAVEPGQVQLVLLDGTFTTAAGVYLNPTYDIGLVQLGQPMSCKHYANLLNSTPSADLVGTSLYCQGWGGNSAPVIDDAGDLGIAGFGTLRSATFKLNSIKVGLDNIEMDINACGQVPWHGDSGMACFATVEGKQAIVGVLSRAFWVGTDVVSSSLTGVYQVFGWIGETITANTIHD